MKAGHHFYLPGPNKHQSAVTCLQFNNKFVITSSDDGTVKLWDVRTGKINLKFSFSFDICSLSRRVYPGPGGPRLRGLGGRGLEDPLQPHQARVRRGLQERDGGDQAARAGLRRGGEIQEMCIVECYIMITLQVK